MSSVCYNCCIKPSKHSKPSRKNINVEPFIDQYNMEGIYFPAGIKDWKNLNEIISQLLLMSCLYCIMKKQ